MRLLFGLERWRHKVLFLRDQAVAKRLLAKFEVLEPVKTKVGGLHVLGAKNSRELTHS